MNHLSFFQPRHRFRRMNLILLRPVGNVHVPVLIATQGLHKGGTLQEDDGHGSQ